MASGIYSTLQHSLFGSTLRTISGQRLFPYEEDQPHFKFPAEDKKKGENLHRSNSDDTVVGSDEPASDAAQGEKSKESKDAEKGQSKKPEEEEHDPTVVTWYGDDDPENPQSFTTTKKVLLAGLLGLYTTVVYIASAIYTPGLELLIGEFRCTQTEATLGLTLFVLGYGVSPLLLSPMSNLPHIGRRNIYLVSFFVYMGCLAGSAGVRNLPGFLVFRLLSGLAGSPAISTVGVSLSDMFTPVTAPRALAVWGSMASLGPILGPLIGAAAIVRYGTWRAPLWILVCVAGVTMVLMALTLPETLAGKILYDRKRRIMRVTGRKDLQTQVEKDGNIPSILGTVKNAFKISIDPTILYVDCQVALAYMILYSWFESFAIVYGPQGYDFSMVIMGCIYLFIGVGVVITVGSYLIWMRTVLEKRVAKRGLRPEDFLGPGKIGVFCMPLCLFWFGWTANRTHWAIPSVATMFFAPGIFLAFMSGLNYASTAFWPHVGAIFALNAFFRSVFAAFGPLYSTPAINGIGVAWYSTILAIVSLFMIPLPWLLEKKGKAMRVKSKWSPESWEDDKE